GATAACDRRLPEGARLSGCGERAGEENGVRVYCWRGTCGLTHLLDPRAKAMAGAGLAVRGSDDSDNDGLVGRCSSHLGQVIRDDYYMDHLDEVNQLLGLVSLFETNPKTVFRQHANRLKNAGL